MALLGVFDVVVHWRGFTFEDQIAISTKVSHAQCHDLLCTCILNAGGSTDKYTGACDGSFFTQENAAEVLRAKIVPLEFPGDSGSTIHIYPTP